MFELDAGEILGYMMVMLGDIFVLIAVIGSFFLLVAALLNLRDLGARMGSTGGLALFIATWAAFHKLSDPQMADDVNGFIIGMGNGLLVFLLVLAALLWVPGMALLVLRRLARRT